MDRKQAAHTHIYAHTLSRAVHDGREAHQALVSAAANVYSASRISLGLQRAGKF